MAHPKEKTINVGIDVGKHQLDAFILERDIQISVANDASGIRTLIGRLARYKLDRVIVEATGRRETNLVLAAAERGLPIIVSALTSKAIAPQQDLVRFARRQQLPPAKDCLCMISWPPPSNAMQILHAWNSSEAYFLLENSKAYRSMMAK